MINCKEKSQLLIFYKNIGVQCINSVYYLFVSSFFFGYDECMCNMCVIVYGKVNSYNECDY